MKQDKSIEEILEHYIDLYSYAFSMLKSKADAEDVLQEAIAQTLSYKAVINPYGFCMKVIKRRCIDLLRNKGTLIQLTDMEMHVDEDESDFSLEMKQVMKVLTARERDIVQRHDINGLSMREIAEDTEIGLSNIKKILSTAHKKMRSVLK